MTATEPLSHLLGLKSHYLTKIEIELLEAELFRGICNELKEIFRIQYQEYFRFMKFSIDKENEMLERNFVNFAIKDIFASGEYTLEGFANYADTHIDVIYEIVSGKNNNPSIRLVRRIIDLHRIVRRDLYDGIIKKIKMQLL